MYPKCVQTCDIVYHGLIRGVAILAERGPEKKRAMRGIGHKAKRSATQTAALLIRGQSTS